MSSLHPASQNSYTEEWDDRNVNATRQGCHPFYGDVVEGGYLNNVSTGISISVWSRSCFV